ncbi:MAG: hypothetical protein Q4F37_00505 [Corynebacterium sp.]|nr:hypothetical protein [Corynebacterium sp.]
MRIFSFSLAAVFSVAAIALRVSGQPTWTAVVAIVVAGVFLALGFVAAAQNHEPEPIVLDEEQTETVRRMKNEGNHAGAIRQVQLWFRYATAEDAGAVVRGVE